MALSFFDIDNRRADIDARMHQLARKALDSFARGKDRTLTIQVSNRPDSGAIAAQVAAHLVDYVVLIGGSLRGIEIAATNEGAIVLSRASSE